MGLSKDPLYALTVLGGLLHDIGKLGWRGAEEQESKQHSHEYYSREFVRQLRSPTLEGGSELDMKKLADVVYSHHQDKSDLPPEVRRIVQIIKEADYDASGSEREPSTEEAPRAPLESVFKRLCICSPREVHSIDHPVHVPRVLTTSSIFPDESANAGELTDASRSLWNGLIDECKGLPPDIESYIRTLIALLEKYTFFSLSAGYKAQPTVPLFTHLKVTAACASALYKHCEKSGMSPVGAKAPYALIVGDLSGIQDFIFNVHSPKFARKGTAKRLRGRSLEVQFVMEGAAERILREYDLPVCNLLWCTGGQFAILAPAYAADDYEGISKTINRELWDKFGDALYLAIGATKFDLGETDAFMKALREAQHAAELKKGRRFFEVLNMEDSPLAYPKVGGGETIRRCPICWMDMPSPTGGTSAPDEAVCKNCSEQEELGGKLAEAEYIFVGEAPDPDFRFAGCSFCILSEKGASGCLKSGAKGTLYKINGTDFMKGTSGSEPITGVAKSFKFMGVTMPKLTRGDGKTVMSFDILSQLSKGADKLGMAKGDVDNLGYIMHSGIDPVKMWSAITLSSLLDAFFAGYLNDILSKFSTYSVCDACAGKLGEGDYITVKTESPESGEGETGAADRHGGLKFVKWWILEDNDARMRIESKLCERCKASKTPVIYINYSGGDDFLIIGPWDATIEALVKIREEFGRFVSGHPDMGLSIGYAIVDSKYPIAMGASELTSRLHEAKEYREKAYKNSDSHRKDMISIFGDCVSLSGSTALGEGAFPFKDLVDFGKMLENGIEENKVPRSMVHELIGLWQASFRDYANDPERLEKARREVRRYMPMLKYKIRRNLKREIADVYDQPITNRMPWIIIPASWASLRSRSRRD